MSSQKTPPAGADLADSELIAFAKAALAASPVAALSALRHMVVDGAASLEALGATQPMLERLFARAAVGGGDDWEAAADLARAALHSGAEGLNLALAQAVSKAVEGSAASRSKWERAPTVDLDFMDARAAADLPAAAAQAWVECAPLFMLSEDAIQALERRPEIFEGPVGSKKIQDALPQWRSAREQGGFWLKAGPNALSAALARAVEDEADELLAEACSEISERIKEGIGAAEEERALERLAAIAKALAKSALAERDPDAALAFLADLAMDQRWGAVESFARESDWLSAAPSFSQLGSAGLRAPHERHILHIKPHKLIEQSEANEAPLGLRELALLWDEPRLDQIGQAMGEGGEQAQRLADTIERYQQAQELSKTDPEAAAALAQSAALLWESHKGAEAAPERPTPRI